MNSQGISSLNYRTFQAVACKKLLISDYREELALFEGNMPFYEDFSDLIFKIESYLEDGAQSTGEHIFGKSITDPCLGWEKTQRLIFDIAEKL